MNKRIYILVSILFSLVICLIVEIDNFIKIENNKQEYSNKEVETERLQEIEGTVNYNLKIGEKVEVNQTYDGKTTGTYDNPIIPKGFAPIDTDKSKWGQVKEDYINGMVIEDRTDAETVGSQFVWIPVIASDEEEFKEIFKRMMYENNAWEEIINLGEAIPLQEKPRDLEEPTKTEVNEMYESVYKNGGFYVARYEAGKLAQYPVTDGTVKCVSLPNVEPWNNIAWGGGYTERATDGFLGDDLQDGAVKVARNMYTDTSIGVKSTLIYGVQWDAIMRFMQDEKNVEYKDEKYIQNSQNMGNYRENDTSELNLTGVYEVKNIYDLAGNVSEWTMEATYVGRTVRGGDYTQNMRTANAQLRFESMYCSNVYNEIGFRVALYIN